MIHAESIHHHHVYLLKASNYIMDRTMTVCSAAFCTSGEVYRRTNAHEMWSMNYNNAD